MGQVNFPKEGGNQGDNPWLIFSFISFMTGAVFLTFYWIFADHGKLSSIQYLMIVLLTIIVLGGTIFTLVKLSSD